MKKKLILLMVPTLLIIGLIGGYYYWTKPYTLPEISRQTTWSDFRLDFTEEKVSYRKLLEYSGTEIKPPERPVSDEQSADRAYIYGLQSGDYTYLQEAVKFNPGHLGYSTALRLAMVKAGKGHELIPFFQQVAPNSLDIQLQLSLSYVDLMQDLSLGTASLGKISYESIEVASRILEQNPYDWMAHYARGINNLYWPIGLQRIDRSIQDLEFCVAVAKAYKEEATVLWPLAYNALGDALVKKGLIDEGFQVWSEGAKGYPNDEELQVRVRGGIDQAVEVVTAARGMGQFTRPNSELTDINKVWNPVNEGEAP